MSQGARKIRNSHEKKGEGIVSDLADVALFGIPQVKTGMREVILGRKDYPPQMKQILKKDGKQKIIDMFVERVPLPKLFEAVADFLSFHKFTDNNMYDILYHVRLVCKLQNGTTYTIEKHPHRVQIIKYNPPRKGAQFMPVHGSFPTLQELLDKTRDKMGIEQFNLYRVAELNCQNFVNNILTANNLNTTELEKFIMQNISSIFKDTEYLKFMANIITDDMKRTDVFIQGGGLTNKWYDDEEENYDYLDKKLNGTSFRHDESQIHLPIKIEEKPLTKKEENSLIKDMKKNFNDVYNELPSTKQVLGMAGTLLTMYLAHKANSTLNKIDRNASTLNQMEFRQNAKSSPSKNIIKTHTLSPSQMQLYQHLHGNGIGEYMPSKSQVLKIGGTLLLLYLAQKAGKNMSSNPTERTTFRDTSGFTEYGNDYENF
jgi:hypothetical protein